MVDPNSATVSDGKQPGAPSRAPRETDSGAMRAGADAFRALLDRVRGISDATCDRHGYGEDGRDYVAMVYAIAESFKSNLAGASSKHREGYLRAMAYLLSIDADNYIGADDDWDPLAITERAFARTRTGN